MRLNKRLSKQSRGWWFETPSCSLWRHSNGLSNKALVTNPTPPCSWAQPCVPRLFTNIDQVYYPLGKYQLFVLLARPRSPSKKRSHWNLQPRNYSNPMTKISRYLLTLFMGKTVPNTQNAANIYSKRCLRYLTVSKKSQANATSGFAPSQWKTLLQINTVCHWLGAKLESALLLARRSAERLTRPNWDNQWTVYRNYQSSELLHRPLDVVIRLHAIMLSRFPEKSVDPVQAVLY